MKNKRVEMIVQRIKEFARGTQYSSADIAEFLQGAASTAEACSAVAEAMKEFRAAFGEAYKNVIKTEMRAGFDAAKENEQTFTIKNAGTLHGKFITGTLKKSPELINEKGEQVVIITSMEFCEPAEDAEFEIVEEDENADTKMETKLLPEKLERDSR